jgi:large subunit ribosomal protein L15
MQIHELKVTKKNSRKRIGRGGKKGTYSGKGMKGQKARSGASQAPTFEGGKTTLVQKTKKLRGFKSLNKKKLAINLKTLEAKFKDGDKVNLESLKKQGLIRNIKQEVKILSEGDITKKIIIEDLLISEKAQAKIEKAGGEIENSKKAEKKDQKEKIKSIKNN